MSIFKTHSILKLAAIFMAVSMMAGTFAMHGSTAFAAPAVSCDIGTFITGNCDMTVTATSTGDVTFANDAAVLLTGAVATGANPFTFKSIVQDQRTGGSPGWSLTAVSPGLRIGTTGLILPLLIGGTATPAVVCTVTGVTCPTVSSALTTLTDITGTPKTFASAAAGTAAPNGGLVTVTTPGSFTLPATAPPGAYTGVITISLVTAP